MSAGEGEHEHNLERYVAPMLTLFDLYKPRGPNVLTQEVKIVGANLYLDRVNSIEEVAGE
jgi:hypothetical protein